MTASTMPCPVCGGVTLASSHRDPALLAVADYLVERVLSGVDDLITRGRAFGVGGRVATAQLRRAGVEGPIRLAIGAPPAAVDKAISGRTDDWRVMSLILDDRMTGGPTARQVQAVLTDYVHDIVADRIPHSREALRSKLHAALGLPVHDFEAASA